MEYLGGKMNGLVYNVTVSISKEIEGKWVSWMKETHIPEVLETGCFYEFKFMRLSEGNQGPDPTYAIQYFCSDPSDLERYRLNYAEELQTKHKDLFEGQFAAFRTVLEIIS